LRRGVGEAIHRAVEGDRVASGRRADRVKGIPAPQGNCGPGEEAEDRRQRDLGERCSEARV
jgi:hypothetical protein